ncbi:MAG TPA: YbhB/YbcL family Raf kinase inhibitor-like protein [Thermopolyspora sp.]|jgi:Raf kinase inhibitor-like protein, YbhB/YbcL family
MRSAALIVAAVAALSGCGATVADRPLDSINVSSPRLRDGNPLPKKYACHGVGNPPLRWSNVPSTAKSLALVVDTNSPESSGVQWVVFNIDPLTTELIESGVPQGALQGRVTSGKVGYEGPCQTDDSYRFSVYALDSELDLPEGAPLSQTLKNIAHDTIARGRLTTKHIE